MAVPGRDVVVFRAAAQQVWRLVGPRASEPDAVRAKRRLIRDGAVEAVAAEPVGGDDAVSFLERSALDVPPRSVHRDDAACRFVPRYVGEHARRASVPDVHVGSAQRCSLDLEQHTSGFEVGHEDISNLGRITESGHDGGFARFHSVLRFPRRRKSPAICSSPPTLWQPGGWCGLARRRVDIGDCNATGNFTGESNCSSLNPW